MIALALLFIVIISLLWLVVRLLKKFFETYSNIYISESNENNKEQKFRELQKNKVSFLKINREIDIVIEERLAEMEQKFPTLQPQDDISELLTGNFKRVLHSSLNLLKTKHNEAER